MEKEPLIIYQKNADKRLNRIMLPKAVIDNWGRSYYMKIYEDHIRLIPIKRKDK